MSKLYIEREVVEKIIAFVSEARKQCYHFDCISPTRLYAAIGESALSAAAEPVKLTEDQVFEIWKATETDNRFVFADAIMEAMLTASPSPAPAVPDAAKPETQGERAIQVTAAGKYIDPLDAYIADYDRLLGHTTDREKTLMRHSYESGYRDAALLSAGPARVEPLSEACLRKMWEEATSHWQNVMEERNPMLRFARAIEAAHGIGKDKAS